MEFEEFCSLFHTTAQPALAKTLTATTTLESQLTLSRVDTLVSTDLLHGLWAALAEAAVGPEPKSRKRKRNRGGKGRGKAKGTAEPSEWLRGALDVEISNQQFVDAMRACGAGHLAAGLHCG